MPSKTSLNSIPAIVTPQARAEAASALGQPARSDKPFRLATIKVAATTGFQLAASGDSIDVVSCTDNTTGLGVVVSVTTDSGFTEQLGLPGGYDLRAPFSLLQFSSTNGNAATIVARIGFGIVRPAPLLYPPRNISGELQRPNNVTPYAVNQNVCGMGTITNALRPGARFAKITRARLMKQSTTTTNAAFRVYFFDPANPPAIIDAAVFPILWAQRAELLPFIDFPVFESTSGSDSALCDVDGIEVPVKISTGYDPTLYYVQVAQAAYVPTANESFRLDLWLEDQR